MSTRSGRIFLRENPELFSESEGEYDEKSDRAESENEESENEEAEHEEADLEAITAWAKRTSMKTPEKLKRESWKE